MYSARVTDTVSAGRGITVRAADRVTPPAAAVRVTAVLAVTTVVVTVKVAAVAPAGTITLAGTPAVDPKEGWFWRRKGRWAHFVTAADRTYASPPTRRVRTSKDPIKWSPTVAAAVWRIESRAQPTERTMSFHKSKDAD